MRRRPVFARAVAALGFLFLYAPIAALIVYSFNASDRVTVWQGFSAQWYGALLRDSQILTAAWLSLRIALASATIGLVLGTLAGFALARFARFRGRTLFAGLVAAPLVMPDVLMGLSLLLFFIAAEMAVGWPHGRGAHTIVLAHSTFATAYVAVVVQSRLARFDTALEEAALDLGATPWRAFVTVTLPIVAPALLAGWLLSFTLSLDDVLIASFVSGPGASTLPMVVFSKVRLGLNPEVNALAALIVAGVALALAIATLLGRARRRGASV